MRIAMLGHKRIPSREGGVEIVVEELSTRMAKLGHEVTVYNRKGRHVAGIQEDVTKKGKNFTYKGVRVRTVWTLPNKSLNAIVYSFFATIKVIFSKAEVVHFHAEGPCSMLPLAKLTGKRCVATIHGLDWQRSKWGGFATRFLLFGEKMAAKYADEVIVLSENVRTYFRETYGRETIYIPNGINMPETVLPDVITEKYGLLGQDYYLFLARIVPEKGLHYLIDAYEQLKTDKKLVIAGGSSHTDAYLEQIIGRCKENSNIIMTGFVQGKELQELFSNCYAYVLPSDIEGMPISLLEAMSFGCNCLVSDIAENMEVVKDYAYHFQKGNVDSLKAELECLENISKAEWSEKGRAAKEYVSQTFDWTDVTVRTLDVYER